MVLVHNQEVRKGWQACKQAVVDLFTKHNAQVLSARRWDERKLAYPIKGQQRATYLLVYFTADQSAPSAIRRELEFSETVLRHLILRCDEVPPEAYQPEAAFDESKVGEDSPPPAPAPAPEAEAEAETTEATEAEPGSETESEPVPAAEPATEESKP
ncbi:MAG TPA: 30S ribosomal protein S6 [Planctomycetota bacterium]|nr:30S ribosomal protein S6 [Planctomycetota bacterium]